MWIFLSVLAFCIALCYCATRVHVTTEHIYTPDNVTPPPPATPEVTQKDIDNTAAQETQAFIDSLNAFMTGDLNDGRN